jgi:retinol-binding protein 3
VRRQILEATAGKIERYYVEPEKANDIAAALRAATFEQASALELVPAVNRVLQAAGGDRHLRFGYTHEPQREDEEDLPDVEGAAKNGYGIHGVQRLEANVGLLTWAKFHRPELAGDAVAAAMRLLEPTDALIIDFRNSDGGSPAMVALLLSYFVPPGDPIHITTIYNRYKGATEQVWTHSNLPGRRYTGKPVYILTSKRTWSAGEGFTEHMRRLVQATVVGETTRGGARLSRWMLVHPNFAVSVSVAKHVGETQDWEGVGIIPDVAVPDAEALATAHNLAKQKLLP